jgi:hypothetical protein
MKKPVKKSVREKKTKIISNEKCLMVKHGNKQYFTDEKNYPMLIEFGKKFDAEISVVKVNEAELLIDLQTLAECLCNPDYIPSKTEVNVEVLESRLLPKKKIIVEKEQSKSTVEDEMEKLLRSGKPLAIAELYAKWQDIEDGDYQKVYNKFIKIKSTLIKEGYSIERVRKGIYIAKKA